MVFSRGFSSVLVYSLILTILFAFNGAGIDLERAGVLAWLNEN